MCSREDASGHVVICRIVKLVRALRKGWIKREAAAPKEKETYLMWDESGGTSDKTATGLQCKQRYFECQMMRDLQATSCVHGDARLLLCSGVFPGCA